MAYTSLSAKQLINTNTKLQLDVAIVYKLKYSVACVIAVIILNLGLFHQVVVELQRGVEDTTSGMPCNSEPETLPNAPQRSPPSNQGGYGVSQGQTMLRVPHCAFVSTKERKTMQIHQLLNEFCRPEGQPGRRRCPTGTQPPSVDCQGTVSTLKPPIGASRVANCTRSSEGLLWNINSSQNASRNV
jgi:hypothetical protein